MRKYRFYFLFFVICILVITIINGHTHPSSCDVLAISFTSQLIFPVLSSVRTFRLYKILNHLSSFLLNFQLRRIKVNIVHYFISVKVNEINIVRHFISINEYQIHIVIYFISVKVNQINIVRYIVSLMLNQINIALFFTSVRDLCVVLLLFLFSLLCFIFCMYYFILCPQP